MLIREAKDVAAAAVSVEPGPLSTPALLARAWVGTLLVRAGTDNVA